MRFYGLIAACAVLLVIHTEAFTVTNSGELMIKFINQTLRSVSEYHHALKGNSSRNILRNYSVRKTNATTFDLTGREQIAGFIQSGTLKTKDVRNCTKPFRSKVSKVLQQHFDELQTCVKQHMSNYIKVLNHLEIWQDKGREYRRQITDHFKCYNDNFGETCKLEHFSEMNEAILSWKLKAEELQKIAHYLIWMNHIGTLNCFTLSDIIFKRSYNSLQKNAERCLGVLPAK